MCLWVCMYMRYLVAQWGRPAGCRSVWPPVWWEGHSPGPAPCPGNTWRPSSSHPHHTSWCTEDTREQTGSKPVFCFSVLPDSEQTKKQYYNSQNKIKQVNHFWVKFDFTWKTNLDAKVWATEFKLNFHRTIRSCQTIFSQSHYAPLVMWPQCASTQTTAIWRVY